MARSDMMRCRPGTVSKAVFGTVPDQRCTASLRYALHRIRDKNSQACRSGVRTTSPSSASLTLIWHDSREFGRTS
jgi:hypothetical protein